MLGPERTLTRHEENQKQLRKTAAFVGTAHAVGGGATRNEAPSARTDSDQRGSDLIALTAIRFWA
eukprot:9223443-Alexandrium_andersonii.AAC.1